MGETGARLRRALVFVALVIGVGAAGFFAGSVLRTRTSERAANMEAAISLPKSLLHEGDAFPEATLIGPDGDHVSTLDIVAAGGVVLFLDLECPPCTDMALRWQRALDDGLLEDAPLCAVTYHPSDTVNAYKVEHGLRFPVYRDSAQVFRTEYQVDRFPLEVVVGLSGSIRSLNYDYTSPIDVVALHQKLDE